ncbi:hypothetical protein PM082_007811 [Marasmius tenuissimus]|nr:hypothetical protein PM082_007811 [Marasmius tenuissimus]
MVEVHDVSFGQGAWNAGLPCWILEAGYLTALYREKEEDKYTEKNQDPMRHLPNQDAKEGDYCSRKAFASGKASLNDNIGDLHGKLEPPCKYQPPRVV